MTDTPTPTGDVNVRLPRELVERLRAIAAAHDRSLSAELRVAVREYVSSTAADIAGFVALARSTPDPEGEVGAWIASMPRELQDKILAIDALPEEER